MPRELATLVHTESTVIVDAVTERCLAAGENIVLEGTFSGSAVWGVLQVAYLCACPR
jgi:2-phosphoglycerate kinase